VWDIEMEGAKDADEDMVREHAYLVPDVSSWESKA
jgi:hypothetical protein